MTELPGIRERDARDRIAETLGLGRTAPIRNLPLPQTRTVDYGTIATIELGFSQQGVCYWLTQDQCGATPDDCIEGAGHELVLQTGPMTEPETFRVCAHRRPAETGDRPTTLERAIHVRVRLDLVLDAEIVLDPTAGTRLLDPDRAGSTDARITRYGARVMVLVKDAQEGVRYGLEAEPRDAGGTGEALAEEQKLGLGPGTEILLRSVPLREDLVLRIRATRVTDERDTGVVEARLPLAVMADPARGVGPQSGLIADWRGGATLWVEGPQESASYQVFGRVIPDRDYRPQEAAASEIATVEIPDRGPLTVRVPQPESDRAAPVGFQPITDPVAGNDNRVEIPLPQSEVDQVLLIRATKEHQRQGVLPPLSSAVRLDVPVVLLVRPDPEPSLELDLDLSSSQIQVLGGAPGVFYHLRPGAEAEELSDAAYMHQRDPADEERNKGIDALAIEVDLVITRDRADGDETLDLTVTPPLPPLIEAEGLAWRGGGELHLRAVKAQTGLDQTLREIAVVPATGEIRAEEFEVDSGGETSIRIIAGDPADRYRLTRDGETVGEPRDGDGADIALATGPIETDTTFELRIERRKRQGIPLVRKLSFPIRVRTTG